MCDPTGGVLTALAIAASAGGSYYNSRTQANAVEEMNRQGRITEEMSRKARLDEQARQDKLRQGLITEHEASLERLKPQNQAVQDAQNSAEFMTNFEDAARREEFLKDGMYLSGQEQSDPAIARLIASETFKRGLKNREQIQALAQLSAMGRTAGLNQIALQGSADKFSTIGGFQRGSQGVSNQEQSILPAQVTPGSTGIGDAMILGGNLLALASGAGMFKGLGKGPLNLTGKAFVPTPKGATVPLGSPTGAIY